MRDPQDRNVIETEPLGGFDPAVTGNDLIGVIDQHRVDKSEAVDAAGNLLKLLLRVAARV
jgi:hypothetical protein